MTDLATRDDALDALEAARADYLARARHEAVLLWRAQGRVTVDDVRAVCPPPPDIDPRVMGAIFCGAEWRAVGHRQSRRRTCHRRPIQVFVYVGT